MPAGTPELCYLQVRALMAAHPTTLIPPPGQLGRAKATLMTLVGMQDGLVLPTDHTMAFDAVSDGNCGPRAMHQWLKDAEHLL